ncbi:MAG: hypothetical protein EXS31_03010 [Pedosphaera sp.]|nr:hypothetical protein [Pedosphaera sp.]
MRTHLCFQSPNLLATRLWLFVLAALGLCASGQEFSPTITSFTPDTGTNGTLVTVRGANFVNVTRVTFNGIEGVVTPFSSTRLLVEVPIHAETGLISVTTPAGTTISADIFTYINVLAPGITGFSPAQGSAGTSVTIEGTNLLAATSIKFNGLPGAIKILGGVLFGTVPANATSGPITIETPEGISESASPFTVVQLNTAPTITSFSPASGVAGTTSVTIRGSNLAGVTSVKFNGQAAMFSVFANVLLAKVPANAATGLITVSGPTGTATSSSTFTVTVKQPPAVTGFSPASGTPGTAVQINGINFANVSAVRFGGVNATTFGLLGSSVIATVPSGALSGPITVVTPTGSATSDSFFQVENLPVPQITEVTPGAGVKGAQIEIKGVNLGGTIEVRFNGVAAEFSVLGQDLFAKVPTSATTGLITIKTPGGAATSPEPFTILDASVGPGIGSFNPSKGPIGTDVEIRGTNFTDVTSVKFGGATAAFTNLFSGLISAIVPPNGVSGLIEVATLTGTNSSVTSFLVIDPSLLLPEITGFQPVHGIPTTAVKITGNRLAGVQVVRFNGISAQFSITSANELSAIAPVGAVTGPITVTTSDANVTSIDSFQVDPLPAPSIASFTPAKGLAGTVIQITGANLIGVSEVKIGGVTAQFESTSSTLLTLTVPASGVSGALTVTTPGGQAVSTGTLRVLVPPAITGVVPTSALVGTIVQIQGANFVGVSSVKFGDISATFVLVSDKQINATVPAGAVTGLVSVNTEAGVATSASPFRILFPPIITGLSPVKGLAGVAVDVKGSNFVGVTEVKLNGAPVKFAVISDNLVSFAAAGQAGSGNVSIVAEGGVAVSTESFEILVPPAIASLAPLKGTVGASVEITGSGLADVTAVSFGGVAAEFTVKSAQAITCVVPKNAVTGPITIVSPLGTVTSAASFEIEVEKIDPPTMAVAAIDGGQIEISWPDIAKGFVLQENGDIGALDGWKELGAAPVAAGGKFKVLVNGAAGLRFYRLAHP